MRKPFGENKHNKPSPENKPTKVAVKPVAPQGFDPRQELAGDEQNEVVDGRLDIGVLVVGSSVSSCFCVAIKQ